jgi:hypothetical protein
MKKLAPAGAPGFAFHATLAAVGNTLHLVGTLCINTSAANKPRTVSAAY